MRRLLIIVAALLILPIIEIAVLIAIGRVIGLGWTLLLVLGTSALGGWLLRREGTRAWRTFREDLEANRPPGKAATDGLLVLIGGIFMLVPGIVSDVIGALLIVPPTRRLARVGLQHLATGRMSSGTATILFGPRQVRVRYGPTRPSDSPPSGPAQYGPAASGPATSGPAAPGPAIEGEIIDPR